MSHPKYIFDEIQEVRPDRRLKTLRVYHEKDCNTLLVFQQYWVEGHTNSQFEMFSAKRATFIVARVRKCACSHESGLLVGV